MNSVDVCGGCGRRRGSDRRPADPADTRAGQAARLSAGVPRWRAPRLASGWASVLMLCLGASPAGASASEPASAPPPGWDGAPLVRELLRLDAQAALAAEQDRLASLRGPAGRAEQARGGAGGYGAFGSQAHSGAPGMRAAGGVATPPPYASHDGPGLLPSSAIRVHAIYGTGQRLHAELSVGGQRYLYRAGRRLPVGMPFLPDEAVPALESIAGACVAVSRGGRTERHCMGRAAALDGESP